MEKVHSFGSSPHPTPSPATGPRFQAEALDFVLTGLRGAGEAPPTSWLSMEQMRSHCRAQASAGVGVGSSCVHILLRCFLWPCQPFPGLTAARRLLSPPGVWVLFMWPCKWNDLHRHTHTPSASSPCANSFLSLSYHSLHETSPQLEVIWFSVWPSRHLSHQLQCCGKVFLSMCLSCIRRSGQADRKSVV